VLGKEDRKYKASQKLKQILEEAINTKANSIDLEYADGGIEVGFWYGNICIGEVFIDRTLESEFIELIVDKSKIKDKSRGIMGWAHLGKQYDIIVEEYENFGESAFKLIPGKAKQENT